MSSLKKDQRPAAQKKARAQNQELLTRIDQAVSKELMPEEPVEEASGPEEEESAFGLSPLLADYRSEQMRRPAIEAIRRFRGQTRLSVHFTEVALNPYLNGVRTMEIYEDDNGYEYWVDPRDDRLIQAAPAASQPPASYQVGPEVRLPIAELRRMAIETIAANLPGFRERISTYHPLEDNRNREVYFFRFDDPGQAVPESELPPFVQIGLRADGQLVSFTDTMTRPEAK